MKQRISTHERRWHMFRFILLTIAASILSSVSPALAQTQIGVSMCARSGSGLPVEPIPCLLSASVRSGATWTFSTAFTRSGGNDAVCEILAEFDVPRSVNGYGLMLDPAFFGAGTNLVGATGVAGFTTPFNGGRYQIHMTSNTDMLPSGSGNPSTRYVSQEIKMAERGYEETDFSSPGVRATYRFGAENGLAGYWRKCGETVNLPLSLGSAPQSVSFVYGTAGGFAPPDNCTAFQNPGQYNEDGDLYGNPCDGDFNQNGVVNSVDFNTFRTDFNAGIDSGVGTDMNCTGPVNSADYNLFRTQFSAGAPGPSNR